jgi:hypothetical protein
MGTPPWIEGVLPGLLAAWAARRGPSERVFVDYKAGYEFVNKDFRFGRKYQKSINILRFGEPDHPIEVLMSG